LSEYEEDEGVEEPAEEEVEIVVEVPVVESGSYLYVCSECGNTLTEIPYYNRFYCENCGLHY
jgi:protein-arginine kinase activator protein McsA